MRFSKLLLAVISAAVLLAGLTGSSTAGRISFSHQNLRGTWTRMNFTGGFGTVECEVVVEGTLHTRTIAKTIGTLLGYVTAANVTRCARGGASVLRETLPWHVQYASFSGTLPNITGAGTNIINASWRIREPTFGVTCLSRTNASTPLTGSWEINARVIESITVGGTIPCGSFSGTISGTTATAGSQEGARVTVTLI